MPFVQCANVNIDAVCDSVVLMVYAILIFKIVVSLSIHFLSSVCIARRALTSLVWLQYDTTNALQPSNAIQMNESEIASSVWTILEWFARQMLFYCNETNHRARNLYLRVSTFVRLNCTEFRLFRYFLFRVRSHCTFLLLLHHQFILCIFLPFFLLIPSQLWIARPLRLNYKYNSNTHVLNTSHWMPPLPISDAISTRMLITYFYCSGRCLLCIVHLALKKEKGKKRKWEHGIERERESGREEERGKEGWRDKKTNKG